MDRALLHRLFRTLRARYRYIIVDAGKALTDPLIAVLDEANLILLVANPDVPCLRNLQRLIDAVKLTGVGADRLKIVLNRASEFGVLSTVQIERVLGLNIDFCVTSDYRTVASAVNSGVPVSNLRSSELTGQLEAIARALCGEPLPDQPNYRSAEM